MSVISYQNSQASPSVSAGFRIGQKRPSSTVTFCELFDNKRSSSNAYAHWSDNPESSPKTPESGIDMNDLGCSPPCYSVTRTTAATHGSPLDCPTDVQMMSVSELQPGQYNEDFYLKIVDEPEEVCFT